MHPLTSAAAGPEDEKAAWRDALMARIRREAQPPEKFSHQPRLYRLSQQIGTHLAYDDDVVFAAAWVHDLGVFTGHRPSDPEALRQWDSTAYTLGAAPALLQQVKLPPEKLPAVLACIRTHEAHAAPLSTEAAILRDADILEQLGAVGVMRTTCKIGRDTRFVTFADAVVTLRRALDHLPAQLRLESSKALAGSRIAALQSFLDALETESAGEL